MALSTAFSLQGYPASVPQASFTFDMAVAYVKKILLCEAKPEVPL